MRARWLGDRGFTIGIDDVTAPEAVAAVKKEISDEKYKAVDEYIKQCPGGKSVPLHSLSHFGMLTKMAPSSDKSSISLSVFGVL